jgi:hypothetical protein
MNTVKFNELSLQDKAMLIKEFGQLLSRVAHCGYWIHLYAIDHYFFEVAYNGASNNIEGIYIAHYLDLNKYLGQITIQI